MKVNVTVSFAFIFHILKIEILDFLNSRTPLRRGKQTEKREWRGR